MNGFGYKIMNNIKLIVIAIIIFLLLNQNEPSQGEEMMQLGANLVQNGALEPAGADGIPGRWVLEGAVVQVRQGRLPGDSRRACLRITTRGKGTVTLRQKVAVPQGRDLLFSMPVYGEGRLVARAGQLSMSYHDQSYSQRLMGILRSDKASDLDVKVSLSSLDGQPATFWVGPIELKPVKSVAKALPRQSASGQTILIERGQAVATIVIPHGDDQAVKLAGKINDALHKRVGVMLPVITDQEATESAVPRVKPEVARRPLILLGRLGTNRAMWPAYNRFLSASDGYYPGGDGYVVRTCANVLRNGQNHIVLGGSSSKGVERSVQQLIAALQGAEMDGQSLVLPWQLDIELGGGCLAAMRKREALWNADPTNSALPSVKSGYGTVRRWYENAMSYYWTGWDSYRHRSVEMIDQVIADDARTHHYLAEFFVRAYDMIDDSPLLTESQCSAVDQLLLKNFFSMTTGPDVEWMTVFFAAL